jgi:hypothetical protein
MTGRAVKLLLDHTTSKEVSDYSLCTASTKVCYAFLSSEEEDDIGDNIGREDNRDSDEGLRRPVRGSRT